ncbi:bacteriophage-type DNA polymerase [Acetobacter nitrogenifigens DSM 23921 = NBRC 105050]|uniref:Uracil-DNA glycosylase n=1 Tax=Acetobacter nitrogenifigens DSM 23921 = NBRC 105050 TaxID=1120919 RepID=A0A511XBW0_9PROT|nr:uracil-DNA glycosylase [Acetobacter nitrogenifigens]GBQ88432.1 bacteriophage-type DNA polymerase [Acetobacter nitrogenifigens DSM 23921 = NBRC 105050]GEN60402.1 uracil-DNA glycosylase [Acetobacter nitrogenifigens DSM 23921 = NBRC 105050]
MEREIAQAPSRGDIAALMRMQMEWGVDAILDDAPHDRFANSARNALKPPAEAAEAREPTASAGAGQVGRQPVGGAQTTAASVRPLVRSTAATGAEPALPDVAALLGLASVEALATAIESFDGCTLRTTATHTVLPCGPVGARVMVIGDAPDADEDRSGTPFSGAAGALFDRMLSSIGLRREEVALAPSIPWRPPGGRPPSRAESLACRPLLLRAIGLYQPERLLLCGGLATRMILGEDANPGRLRGRWRMSGWGEEWGPKRPALPIRHPLQLRVGSSARREIWNDLLLLSVTLDELR